MRRIAALFVVGLAFAVVLPATGLAQAEGCPGSIITTDAAGDQNVNRYQVGETIYIRGRGFPAEPVAYRYRVVHIQSDTVVGSGAFTDSDGDFHVALEEARYRAQHEYQVIVSYTPADGQPTECRHKSDNFFATGGAEGGAAPAGAGAATGFPALWSGLAGVVLIGLFFALRPSRRAPSLR